MNTLNIPHSKFGPMPAFHALRRSEALRNHVLPGHRSVRFARAAEHVKAALPVHLAIIVIFGVLALASIGGGVYAIVANAKSKTELDILGAHLTTGHVGVAFVGIGLIISFLTARAVLKSQRDLAALPPDLISKIKVKGLKVSKHAD